MDYTIPYVTDEQLKIVSRRNVKWALIHCKDPERLELKNRWIKFALFKRELISKIDQPPTAVDREYLIWKKKWTVKLGVD